MSLVSVVIPVKNGERFLEEVLAAVRREGVDETLVIDSGSEDRSVAIARAAGVRLVEIPAAEFGHGRTRNLGMEQTTGDLVCLLTQDATPAPGWLTAYRDAFALAPTVGAAYGPHLPRATTSPMIARELTEFFATFSPEGTPALQCDGGPSFLSNVNACYSRRCWQEIRFREVDYAEDQAFGADMLAAGWCKVYQPGAAVLHAHDYGWMEFMRRYFDEYRGLRETIGHVEPFGVRSTLVHIRRSVADDRRWVRERGGSQSSRFGASFQSASHHAGRRIFSALGSRSDALPAPVRRALSLERRGDASVPLPAEGEIIVVPPGERVDAKLDRATYHAVADVWNEGSVPLRPPVPGIADRDRLRIAMIVPSFKRGSGGHMLLFQILQRLERRGHICSVWVNDYGPDFRTVWPAVLRHDIREFFAPIDGPVYRGFEEWHGADIVLATGWQTVHPALQLDRCSARAYVVNDHEPEFYATSAEAALAADTYRQGLHCIAGSPWLRDLLIQRYGATADAFEYGVDHATYHRKPITRRRDMIVYYARPETPRRAVPIGLMALAELYRRRPNTRIVLFGSDSDIETAFPYEQMGVLSGEELSWLYSEATVGLSLSMTNFSLIPKEMLACGLPCVELAGVSAESIFGRSGPLELVPLEPVAIADALELLLDDAELWERRSTEGIELMSTRTWDRAASEVEGAIRHALRLREADLGRSPRGWEAAGSVSRSASVQ